MERVGPSDVSTSGDEVDVSYMTGLLEKPSVWDPRAICVMGVLVTQVKNYQS